MKKITTELKNKIAKYRKNRLDISELIEGFSLKGEDVSGCIIGKLNRLNDDLTGCNFANCIFPNEVHLSHSILEGCNFKNCDFQGKTYMKYVKARGANFEDARVPSVVYTGADMRDVLFCRTTWQLGSNVGYKAIINKRIIDLWGIIIKD